MTQTLRPLRAIAISSSPSPNSRSRILAGRLLADLDTFGVGGSLLDLIELPADALLGRRRDASLDAAITLATLADILVLATPIYRASYTGQLKAFLDLFPQEALRGRVVGLIATGASPAHALAIDHSLRPLVASLRGIAASKAIYLTDAEFSDKSNVPNAVDEQTLTLAQELYLIARGLDHVEVKIRP